MALEIEGKLSRLLEVQTGDGQRGPWKKQPFVIETFGDYPKKVVFDLWNQNTDLIEGMAIGTPIKVIFQVESREYNERWYTDLRASGVSIL